MNPSTHTIALDLGGTDLKLGRVARDGTLRAFERRPSRAGGTPEQLLATLLDAAAPHLVGAAAIGLGYPGVVDPRDGTVVDQAVHARLPAGFPVRDHLAKSLNLPVVVHNDANAAAWAEHSHGAARGSRVSLTVTVGTGVGCGIVADGRLLGGAWGGGGEIAHMGQNVSGPACGCGVEGCAEPVSGGAGLAARARAEGLAVRDAEEVFTAAASGEPRARRLLDEMIVALGRQVACAVQVVNPDVVVIGGGVAAAGEALLAPLRTAIARFAQPSHVRGLRILPASLGNRAGVIGGGLLAWDGAVSRRS